MTDVELDLRVTALEENSSGGTENGKCLMEHILKDTRHNTSNGTW